MNASDARKTEVPGPEPTPPAAKASSGPESSSSVPGPRRRQLVAREGESLIRCISCGGFLGKVRKPFEGTLYCHRCRTMSAFQLAAAAAELK